MAAFDCPSPTATTLIIEHWYGRIIVNGTVITVSAPWPEDSWTTNIYFSPPRPAIPKNWRWFHDFAEVEERAARWADAMVQRGLRLVQERFGPHQRMQRKRRAWLHELRGA